MKRLFSECSKKMVPTYRKKAFIMQTSSGAVTLSYMAMPADEFPFGEAHYSRDIGKITQCITDEGKCKVLIVTDDENAAMKEVLYYAKFKSMGTDEEDEYDDDYGDIEDFFDDYDDEDEEIYKEPLINAYSIIDARKYKNTDNSLSSLMIAEKYWLDNNAEIPTMMFLGIESVNVKDYVDAVSCCLKNNVFVHIPRRMKDDADVLRLVYEQGFDIVELPENDNRYYEDFTNRLISENSDSYTVCGQFDVSDFVGKCRHKWRYEMSEDRIAMAFDFAAFNADRQGRKEIIISDFEPLLYIDKITSYDRLMKAVGLKSLKKICDQIVALELEKKRNPLASTKKNHMLFYGRPGTGKTTGAELIARILAEKGIGNGKFVVAARSDILGKYVGHTAANVTALFGSAKGGILFVDEAGFFNQRDTGGYVLEALKEFVRYMETRDDVTVIFAMYPDEKKQFLQLDEGMNSRISHFVKFDDYDNTELVSITEAMIRERGYTIQGGCKGMLADYFTSLRTTLGDRFGNARECRKLVDDIVLGISLRNMSGKVKNPGLLTARLLRKIMDDNDKKGSTGNGFGFQITCAAGRKTAII